MDVSGGDINAAIMLGMMALSISMPASVGSMPKSGAPYIGGVLGAFVLFAGLITYTIELGPEGHPYRQILLSSLCFGVALMALPRLLLRVTMGAMLIGGGVFISQQYNSLVRSDEWTGKPEVITRRNREREEAFIQQLHYQLPEGGQLGDGQGWLLEMPVASRLDADYVEQLRSFSRTETFAEWHTPLTGLHSNTLKPMGVWYDGGGVFELVPMDSRLEERPSHARHKGPGPLLGDKSPYQR